LACAWWASSGSRSGPAPYAAAGAFCLGLNLAHVLLRHFCPVSSGGRPVIRFGAVADRLRQAWVGSQRGSLALPSWPPELPHPVWTVLVAVAALAVGAILARVHRRMLESDRSENPGYYGTAGPLRLGLFGAAWWLLAYLPNLFWYLSPRHHHIPSFGWALAWISGLGLLGSRCAAWRPALTIIAVLWFANAVVADVHEGSQWARSAALHEEFLREADRLNEPLHSVFLLGGPRELKRAPVFKLHHDSALAVAWRRRKTSQEGDIHLAPTRAGGFYRSDPTLLGTDAFQWLPYEKISAVGYGKTDGFRCVRALRLVLPDGAQVEARNV